MSTIQKMTLPAAIPVTLEVPAEMVSAVRRVLAGEYEAGVSGRNLTVLDIGANVGSFTAWASHRWQGSKIYAYEPEPGAFEILTRNVRGIDGVLLSNVAIYPCSEARVKLYSRYPGDGEAALSGHADEMFQPEALPEPLLVDALHPRFLPLADVVKLDVEGAELEIIQNLTLSGTILVVLEYHTAHAGKAIKEHLMDDFFVVRETAYPWANILGDSSYNPRLDGDHYGILHLVRHEFAQAGRLVKI